MAATNKCLAQSKQHRREHYVPGLEEYVFTASRDGDDAWGCADHAIGSADKTDGLQEAARKVLTSYWKKQADGWDQQRVGEMYSGGVGR
jgi:ketosteroid isomerase-like protein